MKKNNDNLMMKNLNKKSENIEEESYFEFEEEDE